MGSGEMQGPVASPTCSQEDAVRAHDTENMLAHLSACKWIKLISKFFK